MIQEIQETITKDTKSRAELVFIKCSVCGSYGGLACKGDIVICSKCVPLVEVKRK